MTHDAPKGRSRSDLKYAYGTLRYQNSKYALRARCAIKKEKRMQAPNL